MENTRKKNILNVARRKKINLKVKVVKEKLESTFW